MRHLALCGLMGVGKTTIGGLLAAQLGWPLLDNDRTLKRRTGASAAEIERRDGIAELHRQEAEALEEDLGRPGPSVVTAAASTVANPASRARLRRDAFVVALDADPVVTARRSLAGRHRPGLGAHDEHEVEERARRLRDARLGQLRDVADLIVDTSNLTPDEVARLIFERIPKPMRHLK